MKKKPTPKKPTALQIAFGEKCEAELAFIEAQQAWLRAQARYLEIRQKEFDLRLDGSEAS